VDCAFGVDMGDGKQTRTWKTSTWAGTGVGNSAACWPESLELQNGTCHKKKCDLVLIK